MSFEGENVKKGKEKRKNVKEKGKQGKDMRKLMLKE
jgi:hypothetical protein